MGYDINRFVGQVDEELICPICSGVLEEPLQTPLCEHHFCRACITQWIMRQSTCPIDRTLVDINQFREVPRILKTLLARLQLTCENAANGCRVILKLEDLNSHINQCEHNPQRLLPCEKGCGVLMVKDQIKQHSCVHELFKMSSTLQQELVKLQKQVQHNNQTIHELKEETELFKNYIRTLSMFSPEAHAISVQIDRNDMIRWSRSLPLAKVINWMALLSTPHSVLKTMIKNVLCETGCPSHIVSRLIANAHERRWPRGLRSPEIRQFNHRIFCSYVCKRVPGEQAILILSCDNKHIPENFMVEPGLVMIFANGVE